MESAGLNLALLQEGTGRKTARIEGGNNTFGTQTSREDMDTDPRDPPTNVLLEPLRAEEEAEMPPEADVDITRGSEPTEPAIAGERALLVISRSDFDGSLD